MPYDFCGLSEGIRWCVPVSKLEGDVYVGNPSIMGTLEAKSAFAGDEGNYLISFVGGNAHTVHSLLQHVRPVDFVLPIAPDAPLNALHEVLPFGCIYELVKRTAAPMLGLLAAVRRETKRTMVHVESPPPIGDTDFIIRNLDPYFVQKGGALAISDPRVRWKFWKTNSLIFKESCERLGVEFLPVPASTVDGDGYMRPEGYGNATHGSAWYGEQIIDMLDSWMAQRREVART